jgi:tRNA dimethylallyltransferase
MDVDREDYRNLLIVRAENMVSSGFIEEASAVYKKYGDCPGLRSLGYDFALDAAMGNIERDELPGMIARSHYRYGKRQMAWFRREKELVSVGPEEFGNIPLMIQNIPLR